MERYVARELITSQLMVIGCLCVPRPVRLDLGMYASRKCPKIGTSEIREYKPKHPSGWDGIQDRVCGFYDDGHASKLVRALAHGQKICQPYEYKDEFRIKHDDWLQMGHMVLLLLSFDVWNTANSMMYCRQLTPSKTLINLGCHTG